PGPPPTPNARYAEPSPAGTGAHRSSTPEPARPPAGEPEERTLEVPRNWADNGWPTPPATHRAEVRPASEAEQTGWMGQTAPPRPPGVSVQEQPGWAEPGPQSHRNAQPESSWAGERPVSAPAT